MDATSKWLVVGGTGSLGSAIARELVKGGAAVMVTGRDASRAALAAASLGVGIRSQSYDLQTGNAVGLVLEAVGELGGLDGVINAAGVVAFGPLAEVSDSVLDELVTTNFVGPLRLLRASIPHLSDGTFVNITGIVAEQPVAGMAAYSAAKAGLSAASRALGRELRRQKVRVLDARPPHTETGLASRPIAGSAPPLPEGLDPAIVAGVIVKAALDGKTRDLGPTAFQ